MTAAGWAEILFTLGLSLAVAWPLGRYLDGVWSRQPTWLDNLVGPIERAFYRVAGIDTARNQHWSQYAGSLLAVSASGFFLLYGLLRLQGVLPLNPEAAPGMRPDLAFNTAISFVTNTDWQSYAGEHAASHLAQMAGFTVQNFVSAGSGMAVAAALARAFTASRSREIGNFWVDLVRITLYFLLPIAAVMGLILVLLGVPQTLLSHIDAKTVEGVRQTIMLGPLASQESINQLGTNGDGFFNANAAHPLENPSALANLIEAVGMNVAGLACVFAFGRRLRMAGEARALAVAMVLVTAAASGFMYYAETRPTPALLAAHVADGPNMEGKEVRLGVAASAAFMAITTGSSDGAANASIESMTPATAGTAMFLMQLGEMLPGGAGSGLVSIVLMALLAVLVAGLMVGRTPEYLGKKIEAREVKLVMLAVLTLSFCILGLSAIAAVEPIALRRLSSAGPHGLMEILYAYASAAANNGSAFKGLAANTAYWNTTLAVAMAFGRFGFLLPALAIAGSLAAKPKLHPTGGTFPTDGPLFVGLLLSVILILAGLQYFPSMALGPIVEQIEMNARIARLQTGAGAPPGSTSRLTLNRTAGF